MNMHKCLCFIFLFILLAFNCVAEVQIGVQQQFSYRYATEVAYNNNQAFQLDQEVESLAKILNNSLNQSIFFDTTLIRNPHETRKRHLQAKFSPELAGKVYDVLTDDGVTLEATFFDRDSDKLLVIGSGFTNEREVMSPFVAMFPEYDVVIFDFRGHGYRPFSLFDIDTWPLSLTKVFFGVDGSLVRFGIDEDQDVFAIVDGFKNQNGKKYKQVLGLGVCYGAFIFLKSLAIYPGLFDKLVLDGCWLSLPLFVEKMKKDPKTICDPQHGGWSDHWFFSKPLVQETIEYIASTFLLDLNDISILDYAPKIKNASLLFFYGKDDYMVTRNEFEQLWHACSELEKTVVITSNTHVQNHLKQKELYKLVCDLFFELPQDQFIRCLSDHNCAFDHFTQKIRRRMGD